LCSARAEPLLAARLRGAGREVTVTGGSGE